MTNNTFTVGTPLQTNKSIANLKKVFDYGDGGVIPAHRMIEWLIDDGAELETNVITTRKGERVSTGLWLNGVGQPLNATEVKYAKHLLGGGAKL